MSTEQVNDGCDDEQQQHQYDVDDGKDKIGHDSVIVLVVIVVAGELVEIKVVEIVHRFNRFSMTIFRLRPIPG